MTTIPRSFRRLASLAAVGGLLAAVLVAQSAARQDDASKAAPKPATTSSQDVPVVAAPRGTSEVRPQDTTEPEPAGVDTLVAELPATELKSFSLLGVTWTGGLPDDGTVVEVRWRHDGEWSDWSDLHLELAPGESNVAGTEPRWVGKADAAAVRVFSRDGVKPEGLSLATVDPGTTPTITPASYDTRLQAASGSVSRPPIISRSAWGSRATGSCNSPRYGDTTLGAVVHHTAGSNSYSKSQSAGIVRSAQAYHMDARNWCDIGYNFLVDRYGQIFEGRAGGIDRPVRGAHAGNGPVNEETMGVSLMGTFTKASATSAMKDATAAIIAWRFSDYGIPAKGTIRLGGLTLNRISGHRDVLSTECPGATVYAWLSARGGLRDIVQDRLAGSAVVGGLDSSDVSSTDATITWRPVANAVKYRVYVMTSRPMPSACEPNCTVIVPSNLDSPSRHLTGLKASTSYYVKVSAIDGSGRTITGWQDEPLSFTTNVGGIEATDVTSSAMTVSWKPVGEAAKYRIYFSPSASMPGACEPNCQVVTPSDLSDPSYRLTGLQPGSTYHLKVSAINTAGKTITGWQDEPVAVKLTPEAAPGVVQGIGGSNVSSSAMTVSWAAYPEAAKYRIYFSPSASMPGACEPNCQVVTPSDLSDPSYRLTGLQPGSTYHLKVSAINAAGKTITGWQDEPVAVHLPSTASGVVQGVAGKPASASAMTVSWTAYPEAAQYRIYDSPSASMPGACEPNCQVVTPEDLSDPSFRLTGLGSGSRHHLKVSAINAAGKTITGWQDEPVEVRLPSTASGVVQGVAGASASSSAMTVSWAAYPEASKYRIYFSPSASMPGACEPNCQVVTPSDPADPSFRLTGLTSGTTYHLKVSAINGAGKTITGWQDQPVALKTTGTAPTGTSSARDSVTVPSTRKVTFKGHGYGHGTGMGQYGAEGGARDGASYTQILSHYYPGTSMSSKSGNIRVLLSSDTTDSVMIEAKSGLKFRRLSGGSTLSLPTTIGGRSVIRWSIDPYSGDRRKSALRYRTDSTWRIYDNTTWTGEAQFEGSTMSLVLPGGSHRTYRTALRSTLPKAGATNRDTVNALSIEYYTRGVVPRESPASWHAEALKAQAVAARTYGVRSITSSRYYDICDTTSCQVYGGASAEVSSTNNAVSATSGKILTYGGKPAFTQFSSSSGGYTNEGSQPYLKAVNDPWDDWSGNKNHDWSIAVSASTIESHYRSIGTLRSMQVTKRNGHGDMGGRVKTLKLVGSKGSTNVSGVDARFGFGLRSDWFGF